MFIKTYCVFTALKHTVGPYIFNGNWSNSWPGDYEGAGTVFTYRKENGNFGETIYASGPLTESVDLIVIITISYTQFIVYCVFRVVLLTCSVIAAGVQIHESRHQVRIQTAS